MLNPPFTGNAELDAYLYAQSVLQQDTVQTNVVSAYSPSGEYVGYLKRYIHVKYADDNIGTNLSNSPTNKAYFGLFNSDSTTESTTPADYTWYQVSGGFGTTKRFWYKTVNGSYLDYVVSDSAPDLLFIMELGGAIDLTTTISYDGSLGRISYAKSTNNQLSSVPYNLSTFGPNSFPDYNTWGGSETWQGTVPTLISTEVLFQIDGLYNPNSNVTTWSSPYLATFKVGSLSALSADMGTITAGTLSAGTVFAGELSAATGTFSGSLSAATGSFSGSLSAATGSFAGSLSAATGSFSGSLSAATGTFSGSLTASAIDAVNTINIAGNAVTIPIYASAGGLGASAVITLPINSPIIVTAFFNSTQTISANNKLNILRNGSIIKTASLQGPESGIPGSLPYVVIVQDSPGAGTHTYTVNNSGSQTSFSVADTAIQLLGSQR